MQWCSFPVGFADTIRLDNRNCLVSLCLHHVTLQCEAERVRLSIQNASLKEQLSRLRRADSSTTAHSQQGRTVGHGQAFAGQRRAKLAGFLTPERFSPAAASSSTPGASSGASSIVHGAGICSRSPLLRHSPSLQRKPGSSTGPSVDSGTVGVIGGRSLGGSEGAGRSTGSSSITANQGTLPGAMHGAMIERKPAAQFEPLLTQELKGGRVAAFAGGAAGAFLVSQDFGVVGLSSGPCRHGVTKVGVYECACSVVFAQGAIARCGRIAHRIYCRILPKDGAAEPPRPSQVPSYITRVCESDSEYADTATRLLCGCRGATGL